MGNLNKGSLLKAALWGGVALCTPMASTAAWATDVDAGDYVALPPGSNLAIVYAQFAERDAIYAKGDKQPGDPGLDSTVFILRGVHYMDIAGLTVDPQFLLPLGQLEGKGDTHALGKSGGAAGDLILAATVWLVNKPKSNTYFGITPFVYVPTGSYDRTRPLNLGENRWKFVLQGGFVKGVTPKISIDLVGDVTFYGKNNDFGSSDAIRKRAVPGFRPLSAQAEPRFPRRRLVRHGWRDEDRWHQAAGSSEQLEGQCRNGLVSGEDRAIARHLRPRHFGEERISGIEPPQFASSEGLLSI